MVLVGGGEGAVVVSGGDVEVATEGVVVAEGLYGVAGGGV